MKSSHVAFAVLFISGCMMNGCNQNTLPSQAPIPDQSPIGAGVFRANIDGSPWAAEDVAGIPSGTSTYNGNTLHISGVRAVVGDTADAETIDIIIDLSASDGGFRPGTYELGTIPAQDGEAEHSVGPTSVYRTTSAHSGTVTITAIDMARKVVSGRFAFDGIGIRGQTQVINEGVFDVTWR